MRFRVEHFRAFEAPGTPLGFDYLSTGQVEEIEAHAEADAAAVALSVGDDMPDVDTVGYDPAHGLYGLPGEEVAVRVTVLAG